MATKSSTKTSFIVLCMNLFCYVLTATAHGNSTIPSRSLGPQLRGGFFGGFGGSTGGATTGQQPAMCPRDTLKLGVCANLLGGLVGAVVGNPLVTTPCCTLLAGLADLNAAVCLCTAIKANVLGINLNIPVSLSLLLNVCGKTPPTGFVCA